MSEISLEIIAESLTELRTRTRHLEAVYVNMLAVRLDTINTNVERLLRIVGGTPAEAPPQTEANPSE